MVSEKTWGLIGYGTIGAEVGRQIEKDYVAERMGLNRMPEFIMRSSGVFVPGDNTDKPLENNLVEASWSSLKDIEKLPDVTFISIPGSDNGVVGYEYISEILESGNMAITAEKGAIANFYKTLKEQSGDFAKLGINATVGGGTRLMDVSRHYTSDTGNVKQIHLALNGTLTALYSSVAPRVTAGMSLGQATQHAIALGYAEPGSESAFDVIRAEAEGDIPKKTAIFFNQVLADPDNFIDWRQLQFELGNKDIDRSIKEARTRRFLVSIFPKDDKGSTSLEGDIFGGFNEVHGDWRIVGGFRNLDSNPLFYDLGNLTGPGNGAVIGLGPDESAGVYSVTGPGAGPKPTVNTMIDDYYNRATNNGLAR